MGPADDDWERHKAAIRRLYLVEERSQKQLLEGVKSLGLDVTKAQLEYRLKLWKFKRNIDKTAWPYIDNRINKRSQAGKKSEVIYCGRRVKASTVQKETNRHRKVTLTVKQDSAASPPPPADEQLSICTPPSLPMEFVWPQTLPSLKFQATFSQYLPAFGPRHALSTDIDNNSALLEPRAVSAAVVSYLTNTGISKQRVSASRLASVLGTSLPESYPGEHLMRAEILTRGSGLELLREAAMVTIIALSNNHSGSPWDDGWWKSITAVIRQTGIMVMPFDFNSLGDVTVSAFMEKLFQGAFHRLEKSPRDPAEDETNHIIKCLIKWLLSSGQSPNTQFHTGAVPPMETPLRRSVFYEREDLVQLLLDHAADPNIVPDTSGPSALHAAIGKGNIKLAKVLIEHGANIHCVQELWPQGEMLTALAVAAGFRESSDIALELVRLIIKAFQTEDPSVCLPSLIADGAFHEAAAGGNDSVISYFFELSNTVNYIDEDGVTPLHLAAHQEHFETCCLLLELGAQINTPLGIPSPLHIAAYQGYLEILDLLIGKGADVNSSHSPDFEVVDDPTCFEDSCGQDSNPYGTTPLAISLQQQHVTCAISLIRRGARLTGREISVAIQSVDSELLSTALAANERPPQYFEQESLLGQLFSSAVSGPASHLTVMHMTEALLRAGAQLTGGEIGGAIRLGNLSLMEILLSHGAAVRNGDLIKAIRYGSVTLVETLLAHAVASPGSESADYTGFLEAAIRSRNAEMIEMVSTRYSATYEPGALFAAVENKPEVKFIEKLLVTRPPQMPSHVLEAESISKACFDDLHLLQLLLSHLPPSDIAVVPPDRTWYTGDGPSGAEAPFNTALRICGEQEIRQFLDHGYRLDLKSLAVVARRNDLSLAEMLLCDTYLHPGAIQLQGRKIIPEEDNPLLFAILMNNTGMLRLLLQIGLDANFDGDFPPLLQAVRRGSGEMVRLLLAAGAEVNAPGKGRCRYTAFQKAAELADLELMNMLLEADADVNAPAAEMAGATALQRVAMQGHVGIARHLLELGADPNAAKAKLHGRTALEGAAEHGRIDMIELLLRHGVETTGAGQLQYIRAVKFATKEGHYVAAGLLRDHREWTAEDEQLMDHEHELSWIGDD